MVKVFKAIRFIERRTAFASLLIFVFMFVTKFLGFIKIRLIAQSFGVSKTLDVFWAAFVIPDLIFTLLIAGTVNAALIPVFIKIKTKHKHKDLLQVLNSVVNLNVLLWAVVWILVAVGAPLFVNLLYWLAEHHYLSGYSYGFLHYDKEYIQMFINFTRIMFISPFILGISSIFTAFLNSFKRFTSSSLAPLMYNLGIILTLWGSMVLYPQGGIYNLILAVIVGSLLHLLIQLPTVIALGYRPMFILKITKYVKEIVFLAIPRIVGLGVEQIAIMFDTFWSLLLGAGALSIFKYATSLHLMPVHLFANSILQATFPNLNETAAEHGKGKKYAEIFLRIFFYILWITGIVAIWVFVLKIPIVKLAFGGGKFTDKEVFITSLVLAGFAGAIILQSVASLVIRGFYALHETKKPFVISVVGVIFNIIFAILFSNLFSHDKFIHFLKHLWIYKTFMNAPSVAEIFYMLLHRGGGAFGVVGISVGITLALFIEVVYSLFVLNKESPIVKTFTSRKTFIVKSISLILANVIGFILASSIYNYLNKQLVYSTKAALLEITVVSLISGIVYLIITWPIYWRLVRKLLRRFTSK